MLRTGTESEKLLGRRIRQLLRKDAEDPVSTAAAWSAFLFGAGIRSCPPPLDMAGYDIKLIGSDTIFLVRDAEGEVFEVEIRGNIDSGAWED